MANVAGITREIAEVVPLHMILLKVCFLLGYKQEKVLLC
jgi:hypothetical protein